MNILRTLILTAGAACAGALPAAAANLDISMNARAMGLADSVSADSSGLSGLSLNPAALGSIRRAGIEFTARNLSRVAMGPLDVNGMSMAAGVPLTGSALQGALGLSWSHDVLDPVSLDRTLGLTYGSRSWREIGPGALDAGMTLRVIRRQGAYYPGTIARASVDVGTLYRWGDDKAVGVSFLNLNRPRVDLAGYFDRAPLIFKVGYAQKVRRFGVFADLTKREPSAEAGASTTGSMGTEYEWATIRYGTLAARTGLNLGGISRAWCAGAGWGVLGARLDYALRIPMSGGSKPSHIVTIGYAFGSWNTETEYERLLEGELGYRRELTRALEAAEIKQWKFAEELRVLRDEIGDLRRELALKSAESGEAKESLRRAEAELRLKQLEERRAAAAVRLREMETERKLLQERNKEAQFKADWRGYEDLKIQGVSEVVLIDRLRRILEQYKGTGLDLGEANRELQRLLGR